MLSSDNLTMPTLAPFTQTDTKAHRMALQYWESNRRALSITQPQTVAVLQDVGLEHEWVYARDSSLTAQDHGKWWADCSVPLLAGRALLKTLANEPVGSCQLAPFHAGLVRAARERMGGVPVLFVAQPDVRVARMIMSCHDFSKQIDQRRFWIVTGDSWLWQMEKLLTENPGLATPLQFIRTRLTPDEITLPMIKAIQDVFSKVLTARGDEAARLRAEPLPAVGRGKILLVGGSEFRLWDFGTRVLEQQLRARAASDGLTINRFDMDHALLGSPLALLNASRENGCVVAADVCRADCNGLVSPEIPWITWMTQVGAPPFETAGPRDVLILADEKWRAVARVAGWPAGRLRVCRWPIGSYQSQTSVLTKSNEPDASTIPPGASNQTKSSVILPANVLGLICDTRKITVPGSVADFSSHRLLWELIEEELAGDPLAVEDVDAYLVNRAGQLNIAINALDRQKFVEELILPAYQQGLARLLISAGVFIGIRGKGWGDLPEFASQYSGAISDENDFEQAIAGCRGLIFCWPTRAAHAMEICGKPIVYRTGIDRSALIRSAKAVIGGFDPAPTAMCRNDMLGELVRQLTASV